MSKSVTEADIRALYEQRYGAPEGREHLKVSTSSKGNWIVRHYDVVAFRGDELLRGVVYTHDGEYKCQLDGRD